ncbi:hypothetical protein HanPSC8_Chr09g0370441 [Helianthus annuus]|nr:hypothetical protein HanPSC8_Chr09g0370441 [Helianthus annuus]
MRDTKAQCILGALGATFHLAPFPTTMSYTQPRLAPSGVSAPSMAAPPTTAMTNAVIGPSFGAFSAAEKLTPPTTTMGFTKHGLPFRSLLTPFSLTPPTATMCNTKPRSTSRSPGASDKPTVFHVAVTPSLWLHQARIERRRTTMVYQIRTNVMKRSSYRLCGLQRGQKR